MPRRFSVILVIVVIEAAVVTEASGFVADKDLTDRPRGDVILVDVVIFVAVALAIVSDSFFAAAVFCLRSRSHADFNNVFAG